MMREPQAGDVYFNVKQPGGAFYTLVTRDERRENRWVLITHAGIFREAWQGCIENGIAKGAYALVASL